MGPPNLPSFEWSDKILGSRHVWHSTDTSIKSGSVKIVVLASNLPSCEWSDMILGSKCAVCYCQ